MKRLRVAILGAGLMGSATALFLARRGIEITLFDAKREACAGASRWNEGKIHLGFLYSADSSLKTARRLIPAGLAFKQLVEELIGCSLAPAITLTNDIYLCHRDSVVGPVAIENYFHNVAKILRQEPAAINYLANLSDCRIEKLSDSELKQISGNDSISAGYCVPERSVATNWIADRLVEALDSEGNIEQVLDTRITAARLVAPEKKDNVWTVESASGRHGSFDIVINCLWQGKLAIDASAGLPPPPQWSHRFRLSLFVQTSTTIEVPSAVIAVGPFGDVKNYNGRDFYLSWYRDGLLCDSTAIAPAEISELAPAAKLTMIDSIFDSLENLMPDVRQIRKNANNICLAGGWVFAAGQGELSNPGSTLHQRSDFGVENVGSYFSVNTGKYSTAPWLARQLADRICRDSSP